MTDFVMPLMLGLDVSSLTMSLVNIASPLGDETALADSVEAALQAVAHLEVRRIGDTVVARTDGGHAEHVVVAGRLGTASSGDAMAYVEMGRLVGPGACGSKGALAVSLKAAAAGGYTRDVTFVFRAGDGDVLTGDDLRPADVVLLAEPTGCAVVGDALDDPRTQQLVALTELEPTPDPDDRYGLTRSASLGVPTVAFGPGDPSVAGTPEEFVPTADLGQCEFVLRRWLTT